MVGSRYPPELPSECLHREATTDSFVPLEDAQHDRLRHIVEPTAYPKETKALAQEIAEALGHKNTDLVLQFLLDEDH